MTGTNKYNKCLAVPLLSILTHRGTQTTTVVRKIAEFFDSGLLLS